VRGPAAPLGVVQLHRGRDPHRPAGGGPAGLGARLPADPRAGPPGGARPRAPLLGAREPLPPDRAGARLPDGPRPPGGRAGLEAAPAHPLLLLALVGDPLAVGPAAEVRRLQVDRAQDRADVRAVLAAVVHDLRQHDADADQPARAAPVALYQPLRVRLG